MSGLQAKAGDGRGAQSGDQGWRQADDKRQRDHDADNVLWRQKDGDKGKGRDRKDKGKGKKGEGKGKKGKRSTGKGKKGQCERSQDK